MKSIRVAGLIILALCAASPAMAREASPEIKHSTRQQADKPDVATALTEWKEAVESAKVDSIMKLYDRNAIMISTFAQNPLTKREEIEGYYKRVVVNSDIKVTIDESHPRTFGTMAINSGRYTLSYTEEGEAISIPARFSFTYTLRDGKWLILDQHSSRMPLPEEKK